MSEVELHRGAALERAPSSMLESVMRAVADPSVDPARLREFLQIGRELEADQARREYVTAFMAAKDEMVGLRIEKRGRIVYEAKPGKQGGVVTFPKYEDISAVIKPILNRHGLAASFSFEFIATPPKTVAVMTLLHRLGYEKEFRSNPLPMQDSGGGKNELQGAGSVNKYGRRYVICPAFDILTEDDPDDDASGRNLAVPITDEQVAVVEDILQACADKEPAAPARFKKWMAIEYKIEKVSDLLQGSQHAAVMAKLEAKQKSLGLL